MRPAAQSGKPASWPKSLVTAHLPLRTRRARRRPFVRGADRLNFVFFVPLVVNRHIGRREWHADGGGTAGSARRDALFDALEAQVFDVAVIGGGITGAGVARDAAMRGLSVALIEARRLRLGHQQPLVEDDPRRPALSRPGRPRPWSMRRPASARSSRPSPRTWRARRRSSSRPAAPPPSPACAPACGPSRSSAASPRAAATRSGRARSWPSASRRWTPPISPARWSIRNISPTTRA